MTPMDHNAKLNMEGPITDPRTNPRHPLGADLNPRFEATSVVRAVDGAAGCYELGPRRYDG